MKNSKVTTRRNRCTVTTVDLKTVFKSRSNRSAAAQISLLHSIILLANDRIGELEKEVKRLKPGRRVKCE